ncbi:MAG: methyltransferase domain-containing protein [Desulfamplus sp.]|nr:methyltransferase domain-containing protein [Desulfamplus sp.]
MIDPRVEWQPMVCPLCRDAGAVRLISFDPDISTVAVPEGTRSLNMVRCRTCSLVYLDSAPTPDTMAWFYKSEAYFGQDAATGYTDYDIQKDTLGLTFARFLGTLHQRTGCAGSLADIGCGSGLLLDQARPWFSLRVGSDMGARAASLSTGVCDCAVTGGPREILSAGYKEFDVVTAVAVLEHVYDPLLFIQECASLVKPGGYMAVVVPDFGGLWRKAMGRHWASFKIPEHLTCWERLTLTHLGDRAGINTLGFFSYDHCFPLSVILDRLGIKISGQGKVGGYRVWLPRVMMTVIYSRPGPAQEET